MAVALALAVPVHAHKASDAYLLLRGGAGPMTLRVDVALRDLDAALDLDADGDGKLIWREVRLAEPSINSYLRERIEVAACPMKPAARSLERRADGVYFAVEFTGRCLTAAVPDIHYGVMNEVDPTHRGIARIQWAGEELLRVLTPARLPAVAAAVTMRSPAAGLQFFREGVRHILSGYDHLLFLFCMLLPAVSRQGTRDSRGMDRLRHALVPAVGIVTSFTIAHSITLALAATQTFVLSPRWIEPAIAVTIMLAAIDNVWPLFRGRRVAVTFIFGLIHGFGFASVLAELHLPMLQFGAALLQFNLGLEAGQLAVVVLLLSVLFWLRNLRAYRPVVINGGSAIAMSLAVLWFIERTMNVALLAKAAH